MKYQFQVYNKHLNLIITSPVKNDDYATNLAKRVAVDYYNLEEKHLKDIKANFICEFVVESIINVDLLSKNT